MNNYIGIIIPKSIHDMMPELTGNVLSMFEIWEKTAAMHNLVPCYFRFFEIQPKEKMILAYVKENNKYILKQIPSPKVIYSRVLDHLPVYQSHIQSLFKYGKIIFNVPNYDVEKYKVHSLLSKDSYIRKHLPHTELFTTEKLKEMAYIYKHLILKRNYGECGIGAMKLEKIDDKWCLSYKTEGDKELKKITFKKSIPSILQQRIHKHTYLIQERIPLATYEGKPFDMRVALQKNIQGHFQVSGIMCKVAQEQDFLTNGSQGGTTYSLEEIAPHTHPSIPFNTLVENINRFSLYVANFLDDHYPHLADLGFDLGLTKEGKPYFIECNFISDYVSGLFIEGKIINQDFEKVFSTPIEYAKYLIDRY